jgi:hypothetical protein
VSLRYDEPEKRRKREPDRSMELEALLGAGKA